MLNLSNSLISIVVPAYNEQDVLAEFYHRLSDVLAKLEQHFEIIFINDGSTDETLPLLQQLRQQDPRIAIIDLSRNFGKEIALTAGLHKTNSDAVVVIDADLQDPPELIPELIREWQSGYDAVYAQRKQRTGESFVKKSTAHLFYRTMRLIGHLDLPMDTGDYRILSRRAVQALNTCQERNRFMKGLFAWIGFKQKAVQYERDVRYAGTTKWSYWRLWNFALDGITSFTTAPLRVATYIGLFTALAAFGYGLLIIIRTLIFGNPVPGYPSLIVIVLFLGGIQMMAIGVLGEYIGRIFGETKQRPLYFINEYLPANSDIAED